LVQVNHPRWNAIGYFQRYEMDAHTGEVPEQYREQYSAAFDAIEIYNGLDMGNERGVLDVFRDYLHLLGRGHRYTATGNSDSHKLFFVDPGVPRNLIRWSDGSTDEGDASADPAAVVEAIRGGRVLVTSGPIVDATVLGAGPGQTVSSEESSVPLSVRVRAAPWIDVSRVEIYVGARDRPFYERRVAPSEAVVRFEETFPIPMPADTFVVVRAVGSQPLPNVFSKRWIPMAFTNPIWLVRAPESPAGREATLADGGDPVAIAPVGPAR
jgi:hypothetical protein